MWTDISKEGIRPDKATIKAIVQMPEPVNKDGVRRLIAMLNYLSPFIPNKATIISPLCALLKDGTPWLWTHEHKAAMQAIKNFFPSYYVRKVGFAKDEDDLCFTATFVHKVG